MKSRAKFKKVSPPISTVSVHTYGSGYTIENAVDNRIYKAKAFKTLLTKSLGAKVLSSMPIWDTEWNLRRTDLDGQPPYDGFADSEYNARLWAKSAKRVACLGYARQYVYIWADETPQPNSFEAGQLPLNPNSISVNQIFKQTNGAKTRC